ncbi:MAG: hypothetical protein PVSMB7_04270 [Chloroflexota bacterium]
MASKGSVLVGMSGGVDSSVTAALLKQHGYDVIGMTMQIWHRSSTFEDEGAMQGCCTIDAVDDARRVAARLDIPYYVPNFRDEFSSTVIDDFAHEYLEGRTPNPCGPIRRTAPARRRTRCGFRRDGSLRSRGV